MESNRATNLAAKILKVPADEVEWLVGWVSDYEQGLTDRAPSPSAKRVTQLVRTILESAA